MQDQNTSSADNPEAGAEARPRRRRAVSRAAGPPAPDEGAVEAAPVEASTNGPETTAPDTAAAPAPRRRTRKTAAKQPEATAVPVAAGDANVESVADTAPAAGGGEPGTEPPAAAPRKRASRARKTAAPVAAEAVSNASQPTVDGAAAVEATGPQAEAASQAPRARTPRKRTARSRAAQTETQSVDSPPAEAPAAEAPEAEAEPQATATQADAGSVQTQSRTARRQPAVLFQPPTFEAAPAPAAAPKRPATPMAEEAEEPEEAEEAEQPAGTETDEETGGRRRRRRRGGRGRRRRPDEDATDDEGEDGAAAEDADAASAMSIDSGPDAHVAADAHADTEEAEGEPGEGGSRRRRRRRKRTGDTEGADTRPDDPPNTVVKVREARDVGDEVTSVKGSTRLEAKKQRRREGREAGRRRAPILSEAEFLARREAVDRVMTVRQSGDLTQIAVLEDGVLVEHHVSRASQQSLIGNVYLGRVQNVLPAMEAAFVDIGRGRNAVIYAGEVDWSLREKADGHKRIEDVLKSGQSVLVQVTKDPIGHKGARLTSQISLPGRYVVYVPGGSMSGISRKLPDTERNRLKKVLKDVVPEDAGVIVRTAAEGATEEELTNDVTRLQAQWEAIQKKVSGSAPALLHGEPDLAIKVVRDLFNEDFAKLVVSGDRAWSTIEEYVTSVAGSLRNRVEKWTGTTDLFAAHRVDEQIAKALDRKVWLPSGGSLIIDRTEAMTVVDVNTGKFTGSGGNLEETVTKNNLEAAEEIVRQLRLRDIGGIIVIDFIDMVLEANRDLVLRRLVECLGRDRTKHQVAEVTSLGLVQMTRKRIGTGLLEAFSETCPHCKGRGVLIHTEVVDAERAAHDDDGATGRSDRRSRRRKSEPAEKSPADEAIVAPKLEAIASPGEASPADLHPVGASVAAVAAPMAETGAEAGSEPAAEPAAAAALATVPQAAAEPGPAPTPEAVQEPVVEDRPEQPRQRRGRRRAQRPAGSPDVVQVTDPVGS